MLTLLNTVSKPANSAPEPAIVWLPNEQRGVWHYNGVRAYLSFSFLHYYNPLHMNFHHLRVLNEYRIMPANGFCHQYQDKMQIITFVQEGKLKYRDSIGNLTMLEAGDFFRLNCGTGLIHSEINGSNDKILKYYQIWLKSDFGNTAPRLDCGHSQIKQNQVNLIAGRKLENGGLSLEQDACVYYVKLEAGKLIQHESGGPLWIQSLAGTSSVNHRRFNSGDGMGFESPIQLTLKADTISEFLIVGLKSSCLKSPI